MRNLLLLTILCISAGLSAQDTNQYKKSPAQVTLVYPLGTHGINNIHCANRFSLNLFYGLGGAVDGFEAGCFMNTVTGYVHGFQVAGFANLSGGDLDGAQLAGFANLNEGNAHGLQGAGFANLNGGDGEYAQLAGFANIGGSGKLFQGAGFSNAADSIEGAQLAGFGNVSGEMEGFQGAGFGNIATRLNGVQAAGFGNVAENVEGAQLAGFINIAENVKGIQVAGFINICDSIDGIPFAFISIVKKNGYRKLEVWSNETFQVGSTFKIGVPKFYTSFGFGYRVNSKYGWGFGTGVGTNINMTEQTTLGFDWVTWSLIGMDPWDGDSYNNLNQFKFTAAYSLNDHLSIYGGPTFNILYTYNALDATEIKPAWSNKFIGRKHVNYWFGFQVGMRFF